MKVHGPGRSTGRAEADAVALRRGCAVRLDELRRRLRLYKSIWLFGVVVSFR